MENKTANKSKNLKNSGHSRLYFIAASVISLICAVLMWLYVLGYDSPDFEKKFTQIEVGVIGTAELNESMNYTVLSDLTFSFDVTVSGKKTDVNSMRASDITAYVDVSKVTSEGGAYLPVTVIVPNGITVSSQSVSDAYVFIDELVSAEIPVKVEITDYTLADGVSMGAYSVTPPTVTVQGPKSEIEKIGEAYAHITPGEIAGSMSLNATVTLLSVDGGTVTNSYVKQIDTSVNVSLPVYITKTLPVKVYFVGGVFGTENALITLSDREISVRGTASALANLTEIAVNIDETTLQPASTVVKRVVLPDGVENLSGKDTVSATVVFNQIGRRAVAADKSKFEIKNAPDGFEISVLTQNLNITFMGPIDALRYYTSNYFKVVVDLDGIAFESGDNISVPVIIEYVKNEPGVYANGDYYVNISVN